MHVWHFPLRKLLETRDFLEQCGRFQAEDDAPKLNEHAQGLLSAVKDYKIAAVILADMDLDKVGPVFERINSKGRRLTIVDLMRAATWRETFDINDAFATIKTALAESDYGNTDTKAILRNISAASGKGITIDGIEKLKDLAEDELRKACSSVDAGYRHAVDFLRRDVGVPSDYYLPYQIQLTLLAEFFRLRHDPTAEQRRELSQWFWRTSITNYFKASNTKEMKLYLERMIEFANDESISVADNVPFALKPKHFIETQFKLNTAAGKTFALLLASASPRALVDGSRVDVDVALAKANRVEYHHIFPKAYLGKIGVDPARANACVNICMTNLLGNRRFSSQPPSKYLGNVVKSWGEDDEEIKSSNFIDELTWMFANEDNFRIFARRVPKC